MVHYNSDSSLVVELKSKQQLDPLLMELKESVLDKLNYSLSQGVDGIIRYQGRLCVPHIEDLRRRIVEEAHSSYY